MRRRPAGGKPARWRSSRHEQSDRAAGSFGRAGAEPGMGGGPRALPARARPARERRPPHAARLRRRPRELGDWATGRRQRARRARLSRPAGLRGGALRAAAGARERRPQARRGPRLPSTTWSRTGSSAAEPRRAAAEPEAGDRACRGCWRRDEVARAARPDSGPDAAGGPRPGDARARLLLRAARRGDRQPRRSTPSTSSPRRCASTGKGSKTRIVPIGEPAQRALEPLPRDGAAGARRRPRDETALFVSKSGRRLSPSDVRRRLERWVREAAVAGQRLAAHAAPLLRHPSARGRRRSALDPGAAWATRACRPPRSTPGSSRRACASEYARVSSARVNERRITFSQQGDRVRVWRRTSKAVELRELWRRYKEDGDEQRPRAPRRRLLAPGQVHRRPDGLRAALATSRRPT